MNVTEQERRLAEIEKRVRLGVKTFYDDAEFLNWAADLGCTARVRLWARDLIRRMPAVAGAGR